MEIVVRVLVVDDQEPFRRAARTVVDLTDGFDFAGEAETGEASIEAARELHPDLILMDINLPDIDGLTSTRRILAEGNEVVVFLVSTYDADDYRLLAAECGAAAYIPKSEFGPQRLAEAWAEATGA